MAVILCPGCTREISDRVHTCPNCDYLIGGGMAPRHKEEADDPTMRMLIPVGRSAWAIISGYLGLLSVLMVPGPFAILTGILAIREMKRNPKKHGMGRAVFGIVMGILGTIGLVFMVIGMMAASGRHR